MHKFFYLFIVLTLFSSCIGNKSVSKDDLKEPSKGLVVDDASEGIEEVAKNFAKAIIDNNSSILKVYKPNVTLARALSAKATATMTDEQIKEGMLKDLNNTFERNIENLQKAINDNEIDRAGLTFDSYKLYEANESPLVPRALEVNLKYNEDQKHIPITVLKLNSNWYIFEILNTTTVFN